MDQPRNQKEGDLIHPSSSSDNQSRLNSTLNDENLQEIQLGSSENN